MGSRVVLHPVPHKGEGDTMVEEALYGTYFYTRKFFKNVGDKV
jgi:hypothetical protein